MNGNDELIRRAMHHLSRHGYAVGGKPMALGGFMGGAPSGGNKSPSNSFGGFGGQTARVEAGGGNAGANRLGADRIGADRLGAGSQISNTTSMAERAAAMTNPTAQNARLGPNAAQAMVGAGVSPDAALRSAMSINERGIPAMDRIATTAPTIDATRSVLDYSQKANVPVQPPPANYNNRLNAQLNLAAKPMGVTSFGAFPTMGNYGQMSLDNALSMSNALAAPNDVMQYGMPVEAGQVRDLPGAARNEGTRQHAGVDFAAPTGTAVTPSMPGTVVQVGKASGYGPTIDVQDIYGNIQRYAVHDTGTVNTTVGSYVAPGDTIGTVGAQLVKNPFEHLHFENISPKDQAYNEIMGKFTAGPAFGATPTFNKFENKPGRLNPDLPRISGFTNSPVGGPIRSSTTDWLNATGLKSYMPVSSNVGTPSSLASSFDPNKAPAELGVQNVTSPSGFQHMIAGAGADSFRGTPVQMAASRTGTPSVYEAAANPIANEYAKQAQADAIAAAKAAGIKSYGYNLPGFENQATVTTASTQPNVLGQQIAGIQKTLEAYNKLTPAEKTAWIKANPGVIDKLAADLKVLKEKYKGTISVNEPLPEGYKVVGSGAYNVPAPGMIGGYTNYKNVTFGIPENVKTTETINATTPMARAIAPGYGADVSPVVASAGPQRITSLVNGPAGFTFPNMQQIASAQPQVDQRIVNGPAGFTFPNMEQIAAARPAPVQVAETPITGDVPLPRPRPENLTQVAQNPVTLPRPRPANLDPVSQALQVASNASNLEKFARDRDYNRMDREDKERTKNAVSDADMEALVGKGYTEQQIKNMTQEEIDAILRPENVAGVAPPVTPTETVQASAYGGRIYKAGGGGNQNKETTQSSSSKKSSASPSTPLGPEYLNLLPSLPAYQPINYMTGTGTAATAPSPAIASFNNFATQQVPQMMPPSYAAPSGNTDYVGNNAVANAMRMLRMRQLLEQ